MLTGIHAVHHALESSTVDSLVIEKGRSHPRLNELIHLAKKQGVRVHFMPRKALDRLSEGAKHQGVVAHLAKQDRLSFDAYVKQLEMADAPMLLALDQVTDPHNLGACIRTAEAAGCQAVLIPKDHAADVHSPVVSKAACGALSRLPVYVVTNLSRSIKQLQDKGFWTVGLAGEAECSIYQAKAGQTPLLVVMGSEGKGMRRLVRDSCDQLLHIPMLGMVESLNVSVATGVCLFELVRQRA